MNQEAFATIVGHLVDMADMADAIEERAARIATADGVVIVALASHLNALVELACGAAEDACTTTGD